MRGGPHSKSISSDLGSGAEADHDATQHVATQHGAVIDPKLRKAFELMAMGIHLAQQAGFVPANAADAAIQIRELGRLDAGTYGRCENCGTPIPKARLQAFPRATLCVSCKQREERR